MANGRVTIVSPREPGDRLQDELLVPVGEVFDVVDLVPSRAQLVHGFVMGFAVSAGGTHGCGIRTDRTLSCWGGVRSELTAAPTTHHFTAISAGRNLSCAVDVDIQGFAVCWPDAGLAFGANTVVSVASGDGHACAIDTTGLLRCAGANDANQATPPTAHAYSRVDCGYKHCCAIRTTGEIDCWGDGTQGQLSAPAGTFIDVAAGYDFSCALRGDHTAVCWGNNASGQSTPL